MKSPTMSGVLFALSAASLLSIAGLVNDTSGSANAAGARPRAGASHSSTVTRTGPAGQAATRQSTVTATDNGFQSSSTVSGPNGKTATRDQTGTYDAATGTWTRNATSAGPNGQSSSTSATVQKTETGYARDAVRTGPQGNTATSSSEIVKTENGYSRDVARTGPEGKTVTTQGSATYDATTGTLSQQRTKTGPNGQSSSVSREVTSTPPSTK